MLSWIRTCLIALSMGVALNAHASETMEWHRIPKTCDFPLVGGHQVEFTMDHLHQRVAMIDAFWERAFQQRGWPFEEVRIVTYQDSAQSVLQTITADLGPVYVPPEKAIYLSMDFENRIANSVGPMSDALLTVILAHEYGHHVQNITGTSARAMNYYARQYPNDPAAMLKAFLPPAERQADCLAGVFFHYLQRNGLASQAEINDAAARLMLMGDDVQLLFGILRNMSNLQGLLDLLVNLSNFSQHASSGDRAAWFNTGLASGDPNSCETFPIRVLTPH